MELVYRKNYVKLKKIYDKVNAQEIRGDEMGQMNMKELLFLLEQTRTYLVGGISRNDVLDKLVPSQILSVDEVRDRKDLMLLTFSDFLELIARIADMCNLPTDEQIRAVTKEKEVTPQGMVKFLKYLNRRDYKLTRRPSTTNITVMSARPLHEKFEKFLWLWWYALYPEGEGVIPDDKIPFVCNGIINGYYDGVKIDGLDYFTDDTKTAIGCLLHYDEVIDTATGETVKYL